ncbi:DUF885 domain-containing protein [Nakamurella antarctica]|uniref:DUF885 domain-containing protein n=1 Tax=Nakamurella antarctica TaxID=1902245 RepID=A0A3G8ZUI0_9ACTN|nr:DUF885 domain-containing protein [Nakamurella antarctica]AZI57391.1 DUF885 domain-containing protein [Nakamurella antarctica]
MNLVTEYLKLGLRFDRVVEGYVDAYFGDPALKAQVAGEEQPDPAELGRQAAQLSAEVANTDLTPDRAAFITSHLDALAVGGAVLAGENLSFISEVHSYFQVEIAEIPTQDYEQAHQDVSDLIGGVGDLGDRLSALRAQEACPPELVEKAVATLAAALRERVVEPTGLTGLDEHIGFEIERDVAWSGFNYYLGNFTSRVAVNADIGHRMSQLPVLVAHECYPGHHTEHCRKESLLVQQADQQEQTIFLVNTPQCLMAEGLGDLALTAAVGPGWARWAQGVLAGIGPTYDPDLAEALEIALRPLNTVRQNAAIMLHDKGTDPDVVIAYMKRWLMVDEARARQMLRFMSDPLWRAYTSTYVEGERLLRPWLEARPVGQSALTRFQRLLDEPLTPSVVQAEMRALAH